MPRIAEYGLLLAAALAVVATGVADAQDPAKGPIVILVGFSAGGTTDLIARLMAEKLANALQRPVVVEDKPGAGGRLAAGALKNATPDGTTLMVAPIVVPVLAPLVYRQLDYDPARDFAPVGQIARFQFAFAVGADHPARTLSQFVDWAKANPSQASFGTPGAGSIPHFLGVMIARATGIEMTHVPYKGLPALASDLIGRSDPCGYRCVARSHRACIAPERFAFSRLQARRDLRCHPWSLRFRNRDSRRSRLPLGSPCTRPRRLLIP